MRVLDGLLKRDGGLKLLLTCQTSLLGGTHERLSNALEWGIFVEVRVCTVSCMHSLTEGVQFVSSCCRCGLLRSHTQKVLRVLHVLLDVFRVSGCPSSHCRSAMLQVCSTGSVRGTLSPHLTSVSLFMPFNSKHKASLSETVWMC